MLSMEKNLEKWQNGLSKTRKSAFGKIATFFGASEIDNDTWEKLEDPLHSIGSRSTNQPGDH